MKYKIKTKLKIPTELKRGEKGRFAFCVWNASCVTFPETEADAINVWRNSLKGASADTC